MNFRISASEDGNVYVFLEAVVFKLVPEGLVPDVRFSSYLLTTPARELAATLNIATDVEEIGRGMWSAKPTPKQVERARIIKRDGDSVEIGPWEPIARN